MASVTTPHPAQAGGALVDPNAPKRTWAQIAERTWIWSVVGYTVLRFVIAWGAFSEHGANVWIFGLLDVGTAWPYAKAVALVCKRAANSSWRRLPLPVAVALASFFAPYAYLWFAAGEMPTGVRVALAICVSVLLLAATAGILFKTRKLRRTTEAVTTYDVEADVIIDIRDSDVLGDVLIDLTGETPKITRLAPVAQA